MGCPGTDGTRRRKVIGPRSDMPQNNGEQFACLFVFLKRCLVLFLPVHRHEEAIRRSPSDMGNQECCCHPAGVGSVETEVLASAVVGHWVQEKKRAARAHPVTLSRCQAVRRLSVDDVFHNTFAPLPHHPPPLCHVFESSLAHLPDKSCGKTELCFLACADTKKLAIVYSASDLWCCTKASQASFHNASA